MVGSTSLRWSWKEEEKQPASSLLVEVTSKEARAGAGGRPISSMACRHLAQPLRRWAELGSPSNEANQMLVCGATCSANSRHGQACFDTRVPTSAGQARPDARRSALTVRQMCSGKLDRRSMIQAFHALGKSDISWNG